MNSGGNSSDATLVIKVIKLSALQVAKVPESQSAKLIVTESVHDTKTRMPLVPN